MTVVTSQGGVTKTDDMYELPPLQCGVPSWLLEEYLIGVEDDDFYNAIASKLDAPTGIQEQPVPRAEHVKSKYFYAGGSARWMFDKTTSEVMDQLDNAIGSVVDPQVYLNRVPGQSASDVVNRLFNSYWVEEPYHHKRLANALVSEFAMKEIALRVGPDQIKTYAENLKYAKNPSLMGTLFEMYLISLVGHSNVEVNICDGDSKLAWPKAPVCSFDPKDPKQIEVLQKRLAEKPQQLWLKPVKYTQGGYDLIFVDKTNARINYVNATIALTHDLKIQYVVEGQEILKHCFEVEDFEFVFVIPDHSEDFELGQVQGGLNPLLHQGNVGEKVKVGKLPSTASSFMPGY